MQTKQEVVSKTCPECRTRSGLQAFPDVKKRQTVKRCKVCKMTFVYKWEGSK